MLDPALQSVGNRASLPALKPTGQSAADSPKGSRQVLADVAGHFEPEQRSSAATVSRRIAFFIKDSESSATRRDLFDNFLNCIRSPLHVSRLHKYFQLPTCNTQARRMQRLDCNRDAVRLNYCQLERIHARARVDMSMLATGKMAFKVESGLIVRPYVCSNFFSSFWLIVGIL